MKIKKLRRMGIFMESNITVYLGGPIRSLSFNKNIGDINDSNI